MKSERENLVWSVVEDIVEAAAERDYCDREGTGDNFDKWNIYTWVEEHLEDLDLDEGTPIDWAEVFMNSYNHMLKESRQVPVSDLDKIKEMPRRKEVKDKQSISEENILNEASEYMGIPILNLKKPVKAAPEAETLYECAVKCGSSYQGFESVVDAEKFIKRNYLLLMWRD